MQPKSNLYFIAIIPPEPIYSEIKEFQKEIAEKFHSIEAFKRPAHITLVAPFMVSGTQEKELKKFIVNFGMKQTPFELSIDGFGSFSVHTIYAAFEENILLGKMQKDISSSFYKKFSIKRDQPNYRFTPHITIGFKDLTPPMFELAWPQYRDKLYRRKWMLKYICLLKHNFKEWEIIEHAELKGERMGETLELGL
jgi:2'-5' RNA ligase